MTGEYVALQLEPENHKLYRTYERPEHIACSSTTNSEIVIPVKNSNGDVVAVLDVDSDEFDAFSEDDISLAQDICDGLESPITPMTEIIHKLK